MENPIPSFLITGPSRAGKSTLSYKILEHIQDRGFSAGGVITLQNSSRWFYLIQSGERLRFEAFNDEPVVKIGKFYISKTNLEQAIQHIKDARNLDFLFIDEIGILEMNGGGYFPVLKSSLSRTRGNIFIVRESIFEDFKRKFNPKFNYEVLRCSFELNPTHLNHVKRKIDKEFINQ